MNLIDHELDKQKEKNKKTIMIIVIAIFILILIGVTLLSYLSYLKSKQFKFIIDGKTQSFSSDLFYFDEDGEIYISIKDLTNVFCNNKIVVEYNNGNYKGYNEDITECHVEGSYEVAGYKVDSEEIYKVVLEDNSYEYYTIDKPVKSINGKLYTTERGIEIGFNVMFSYDKKSNSVKMYTLDTLVNQYSKQLNNTVIISEEMSFVNKKALKYDMIIIKNSNNEYGVQKISSGETIIGTKYSSLKFIESTQDFIVTTPENKQGIISTSGAQNIEPQYTEIKQLDSELKLYLIKNNKGKYGVYNRKMQKTIIYPEYDAIGINQSQFENDDIDNPYILYNSCIPCKKIEEGIEKWELLDTDGNKITQQTFDSLGYVKGNSKTAKGNNLLLITEIEGIIVYNDAMYGIINSSGKTLVPIVLQQVYSESSAGENTYYMVYNNQTYNILETLNKKNSFTNNTVENNSSNNNTTVNEIVQNNVVQNNTELNNTVSQNNTTNKTNVVSNQVTE